jgi:hypothetical protein
MARAGEPGFNLTCAGRFFVALPASCDLSFRAKHLRSGANRLSDRARKRIGGQGGSLRNFGLLKARAGGAAKMKNYDNLVSAQSLAVAAVFGVK